MRALDIETKHSPIHRLTIARHIGTPGTPQIDHNTVRRGASAMLPTHGYERTEDSIRSSMHHSLTGSIIRTAPRVVHQRVFE